MRLYFAIFVATLSTVFVPLPEEATLLAAGYAARVGRVTLVGAAFAAWIAVLLGDMFSYVIGRFLLAPALRTRIGQRLLPAPWRAWSNHLVATRGGRAIVVARFLVGLRGFVYLAVGAARYPFGRFLVIDSLAGAVEVAGLTALGFECREMRSHLGAGVDLAAATLLVAALFGPMLVRLLVRRSMQPLGATNPRG